MQISAATREAEKTIIGSVISGKVSAIETGLKGSEFTTQDFRDIFIACLQLESVGAEINPITVSQTLHAEKSKDYIPPTPKALNDIAIGYSNFNIKPCLSVINENHSRSVLKELFAASAQLIDDKTESPLNVMLRVEDQLNLIRQSLGSNVTNLKHVSEIAPIAEQIYDELKAGISQNIPTGITAIDDTTGGGSPGDVWIIGAFTGGGKSGLALQMARNQSELGISSLIISREMLDIENFKRLHSSISGVPLWQVKPKMHDTFYSALKSSIGEVAKQNIWIDSTSADMPTIKRSIKEAVKNHGVKVVYVDYLQLLSGAKGNRQSRADEVAHCSRTLKEIAMETETLIISLAQYNRMASYAGQAENHSFAESSGIEKDASIVLHLELEKVELKPDERPPKWRKATIRIGKARNAPVTETQIWFRGETFTFTPNSKYPEVG